MEGLFPAVVTPFGSVGEFLPGAFARHVEWLYGAGMDGLFVCGNCGEGANQELVARKEVVELAVRLTPPNKRVIVHVGGAGLLAALDLAAHAEHAGASAVSSVPPDGVNVRHYFESLVNRSNLPVWVYYYPAAFPSVSTADELIEICDATGIAGVKFTDYRLHEIGRIRRSGLTVLNGHDEALTAGLLSGAAGGIGAFYNVLPDHFVQLYRLARTGEWDKAQLLQNKINMLIIRAIRHPVVPAVKQLLAWTGHDCGVCRPPLRNLGAAACDDLREALVEFQSMTAGEEQPKSREIRCA